MEKQKIGFLGPVGTFGNEAALRWMPDGEYIPFSSHLEVLDAVRRGDVVQGIVAVENSIDGPVTDVMDDFIHGIEHIWVCGEVVVPVNQCLITKPGVVLEDIQVVISHPKALGQCGRNIRKHLPGVRQVACNSTAAAVVKMLEESIPAAAIAGHAAVLPGSVVLRENFQDVLENATRFWVAGQQLTESTGYDKTSLVFETFTDKPGALLTVYAIFAARGLNLSKIESRPARKVLGQYVFLLDVEAHQDDPEMKDALMAARLCTPRLKVFGSYPRWRGQN